MTTDDEDLEEYGLAVDERKPAPAPAAPAAPDSALDPARPFGRGISWPTRNVGVTLPPASPGRSLSFDQIAELARQK